MALRRTAGTAAPALPRHRPDTALAATALCLGSSLAWAPGTLHRFVLAKLLVLALGVLLAATAVPGGRLPRAVVLTLGAGAVVLVLAALVSPAPAAALLGRWPRYEGLVALPLYVGAAWSGARLLGPGAPGARTRALRAVLTAVALLVGIVTVVEALGGRPLGGDTERPGALLGNAGDQGVLAAIVLVALLALTLADSPSGRDPRHARDWLCAGPGIAAAAATVVLSGSRAALLAAVLGLALLPLGGRIAAGGGVPPLPRRAVLTCLGLALALVAAAAALPSTWGRVTGADALAERSATGRGLLVRATARLVADSPWTGAGPSGFVDAAPRWLGPSWWAAQDTTAAVDSPHSWPAQAAATGGLPLLVLALVLAVVVLRTARHRLAHVAPDRAGTVLAGAAAVVVAGSALLAQPTSAGTVPTAAFLAGALLARPVGTGPTARGVRPAALAATVAAALAVLLGTGLVADRLLERAYDAAARGDAVAADLLLADAARWRPWDADLPASAAAALVPLALAGVDDATGPALRWADRAVQAVPTSPDANRLLAEAHLADQDPEAAVAVLEPLVADLPEQPELHLVHGIALAMSGDLAAAQEPLRVATRSPATAARAWPLLAEVLDALDRPMEAAEASRHAGS